MTTLIDGLDASSPVAELGRKLFLRSVSSSVDERFNREADQEESASDEDESEEEVRKRRARRRSSLAGAKIASQIPPRTIVDNRFVVSPEFVWPTFDMHCYRIDKDLYFFHQQDDTSPFTCMLRISKLPKGLLGSSTWQVFAGTQLPLAVLKQVARTINPTFYLFRGTDSKKGEVIYSFKKKVRSRRTRVFNGEGCRETALLKYFSLIGDDRMYMKLKDASVVGGEGLGETIVDWRAQTSLLRVGKGFDLCLAAACLCLAESFDPHSLEAPSEIREAIMQSIRASDRAESGQQWRQLCGW